MPQLIERLQRALGGDYRVERELPLGGLGRLFLAEAASSGGQVVVMVLPPDVAARTNPDAFRRAIAQAARLRHPAILPVLAAGGDGELLWCVAQHVTGESLRFRLLREGAVLREEALQVLRDTADALAYAHALGVCHGDVKADNIFLKGGGAVVADFGIRWALHAAGGGEGPAPTPAADVRALAAVGQAMLAGGPGAVPEPIADAERYPAAAQFRDALGTTRRMRQRRLRVVGVVAVAGLALAGSMVAAASWRARDRLHPDRVVVAPFEILAGDPDLALWREGLVDLLSANLDGAGPLHTVSPSVAIRRWDGRHEAASAAALGRRTGARMAVFGRVLRGGGDSVRITAQVIDALSPGTPLAEVDLGDRASRLDRLADSLTVALLRELGRSRPIGAVRRAALGRTSLPALKLYLAGEQHYRRSEWDRALASYEHAIALDSMFALPYYRAGIVLGWVLSSGDSMSTAYLIRAASLLRGLPARDSMLIVAESLGAAVDADDRDYWQSYRRLYATVADALRRYPGDPEVWYEAAETQHHYPFFSSLAETRAAFDQAIAHDSSFAPAYIHPIELSLQMGEPERARRYIDAYLRLEPRDIYADGVRLTRLLLDPRAARSDAVRRALDTASLELLHSTIQQFRAAPDTQHTLLRLLRQRLRTAARAGTDAEEEARFELAEGLAFYGRLAEARRLVPSAPAWLVGGAALLGAMPADTAAALFAASLHGDGLWPRPAAVLAAPWWAERRDSASLRELARRADSLARAADAPRVRAYGQYVAGGARAFLALARADTGAALAGLMALGDSACERCTTWQVARATLLVAAGRHREAAELLRRDAPGFYYPTDGLWMVARARAADRLGDRRAARAAWMWVRGVWWGADAPLVRYVEEAEAALARLGGR